MVEYLILDPREMSSSSTLGMERTKKKKKRKGSNVAELVFGLDGKGIDKEKTEWMMISEFLA